MTSNQKIYTLIFCIQVTVRPLVNVESFLQYDWFFSSWDVDDHVPIDEDGELGPVSGMNQELLVKAETLGELSLQIVQDCTYL